MIQYDGTARRCDDHPDLDLPTEQAAVEHLATAHPDLWQLASEVDATLVARPPRRRARPDAKRRRALVRESRRRNRRR